MGPQALEPSIAVPLDNSASEESNRKGIDVVHRNRLVSPRVGDVVCDNGLASATGDMWLKVGVFYVDSRCVQLG